MNRRKNLSSDGTGLVDGDSDVGSGEVGAGLGWGLSEVEGSGTVQENDGLGLVQLAGDVDGLEVNASGELDGIVVWAVVVGVLWATGTVAQGSVAWDGAGDVGVGQVELDVDIGWVLNTLDVGESPVAPIKGTGSWGGSDEAEERGSECENFGGVHLG